MAALVPTQHPAAASCKALAVAERWPNGKFSPRAPVQFLHLRLIPHFHPMNCTSWGHNPGLPVKLSTFRYFLLASLCSIFFFFFSFANESTISLPWPGKSASAPQQTFALALKLLTSRQLVPLIMPVKRETVHMSVEMPSSARGLQRSSYNPRQNCFSAVRLSQTDLGTNV